MLAAFTTFDHLLISACMKVSNCSGELPIAWNICGSRNLF